MLKAFQSIFNIPELRKRIGYTLLFLIIFRLGAHVPVPGINTAAIARLGESGGGTLFGLIDMFSGGAFKQLTVFALGIMPYISASIILQLLTVVVPYLERLAKEGEQGSQDHHPLYPLRYDCPDSIPGIRSCHLCRTT